MESASLNLNPSFLIGALVKRTARNISNIVSLLQMSVVVTPPLFHSSGGPLLTCHYCKEWQKQYLDLGLPCLPVNIGHQGLNRLQWLSTISTELQLPIQVTRDLLHKRLYPEQTATRLGSLLQALYMIATVHDNIQRVLPGIPTPPLSHNCQD
jgi:hypothetical protein